MNLSALPPSWWQQPDSAGRRVVYPSAAPSNNFAPANIGQAKYMAKRAIETLRMHAPTVASQIENDLVGPGKIISSWDLPVSGSEHARQQYAPLLIGQLKAIADPFYTRIYSHNSTWLQSQLVANGTKDPADSANFFPWTSATGDDANNAVATIGQLKAVFSLHFEQLEVTAPDENEGTMARLSVVGNMAVRVTNSVGARLGGVKLQFTRLKGNGTFPGGLIQKTYTTNSAGEVVLLSADYTSPEDDIIRVSMLTQQGRQNVWLPADVSSPVPIARAGSGGYDYQAPGGFTENTPAPQVNNDAEPWGSDEVVKSLVNYIAYDAEWTENVTGTDGKKTTTRVEWSPVLGSSNGIGGIDDYSGQLTEVPGRVVTTVIDYNNSTVQDSVTGPTVIHDIIDGVNQGYEINGYTLMADSLGTKTVATMDVSGIFPLGVGKIDLEHAYAWLDADGNQGVSERKKLQIKSNVQEVVTSTDRVKIGNGAVTSVIGPFISRGFNESRSFAEPGVSYDLKWREVESNEIRFDVENIQSLRAEVIADETLCSGALPTIGWMVESSNPEIGVAVRCHNGTSWIGRETPQSTIDYLIGSNVRNTAEILIQCDENAADFAGMITVSFIDVNFNAIVAKEFKVVATSDTSSEQEPSYNEGVLTKTITNNESSSPKYRKIALDGRPIADEKPQGAEETDEADEETYVDALTRELRHATSDIYVPVPGSDLALSVKRNVVSEIWNPTSGLCPHEDPTLAFGPVWRTNLAANIHMVEQFRATAEIPDGDIERDTGIGGLVAVASNEDRKSSSARQRDPNYAFVTDEDGNSHRFMISYESGVRTFVPAPTDKNEFAASELSLKFSGTSLIFSKTHGNTLLFEKCIDFELPSVRMAGIGPNNGTTDGGILTENDSEWGKGVTGMQVDQGSSVGTVGGGQVQNYVYYRLVSVTDRFGTTLLHQYDGAKDIVPKTVKVDGRPDLAIQIHSVGGKIKWVSDPMGNQTFYEYDTLGKGTLTKVVAEGVEISKYGYKRWEETDYRKEVTMGAGGGSGGGNACLLPWGLRTNSDPLKPSGLFQYGEKVQHYDLASISDAENNTYTFHTVVDKSHTIMSVSNFAVPSDGANVTFGNYLQNGLLENGGPCVMRYPLAGFPPDVERIDLPGGGFVEIGDSDKVPPVPGSQVQFMPLGQRHTVVKDAEGNRRTYVWDKAITVAIDQEMMEYTQEISIGSAPRTLAQSVRNLDELETEQPSAVPSPTGSTAVHTYYTRMSIGHDKGGKETYVFNFMASGALASVTDFSGNVTKYKYGLPPLHPDPVGATFISNQVLGNNVAPLLSKPTSEIIPAFNGLSEEARTTNFSYGHQGMLTKRFDRNGLTHDFGVTDTPNSADILGRSMGEKIMSGSTVLGDTVIRYQSDTKGSGLPGFVVKRTKKKLAGFVNSDPSWVQDLVTLYEPDELGRIRREASDMDGDGEFDDTDLITSYTYDRNGNKLSVTDPSGFTTWFHYDRRNRLVGVVNPDGSARSMVYNKRGKKVLERDENGVATGFVYDARGRLTKIIRDMNGNLSLTASGLSGIEAGVDIITEKVYDKVGSVIQTKDARGFISVSKYDHLRRLTKSIVPDSARLPGQIPTEAADDVTTYEYGPVPGSQMGINSGASCFDSSGFKPTKVVDPRGYISYFIYDELYRCIESRTQYSLSPAKFSVKNSWYNDITGVLDKVEEPRRPWDELGYPIGLAPTGGRSLEYTYDELFRPKAVVERSLEGTLPGASELTTFYTSTGLVWKTKKKLSDGVFAETETKYDRAGRVTNVWAPQVPVYDPEGGSTTTARPETITAYDRSGLVISKQDPRGCITTFVYDARGRQIEQISPVVYDYDASGNRSPLVSTAYDKVGNVVRVTDPRGNSIATYYDAANRAVKVVSPSYQDGPTSPVVTPVTQTLYDAAGNPTKLIDPRGSVTINTYDSQNRLTQTKTNPVVPAGSNIHTEDMVTTFSWDKAGNRTRVVDAAQQHTSFEYDGLNRLTATIWDSNDAARKKTELAAYDALVQTTKTDPRGNVITYQYADRLFVTSSACSDPDFAGDAESRSYDSAGRLLTVTATGSTDRSVSYTYDALDQVKQETSAGYTHQYEYDVSGNRTRVTYGKTNRVLISHYDALNRLSRIVDSTRLTDYKYDVAGNLRERLQANSTNEVSVYDALGRRKSQKTTSGSIPISCFDYSHDAVGNLTRTEEEYSSTNVPDRIVTNTYDRLSRLVTETADSLNSSNAVTKSVLTTYSYSKANNRTLKNMKVTEGGVLTENVDQSYSYGSAQNGKNSNQLDTYVDGATGQTTSYTYDAAGNRQTKSVNGALKETYGWDSRGRLTSLSGTGSADDYSYSYDYRSRRVTRNESDAGGSNTTVCFSGGSSVFETVGSATQVEFIRGSDYGGGVGGILYSLRGATPGPRFNAYNSRGDVVAQTCTNGAVTWQATYEAFGTRTEQDGDNQDRQKANTKEEDPTGLLNEGFRYRDLATGLFISRDPLGFVDGPNVYTYVMQNPWTSFDPLGLRTALGIPDDEEEAVEDRNELEETREDIEEVERQADSLAGSIKPPKNRAEAASNAVKRGDLRKLWEKSDQLSARAAMLDSRLKVYEELNSGGYLMGQMREVADFRFVGYDEGNQAFRIAYNLPLDAGIRDFSGEAFTVATLFSPASLRMFGSGLAAKSAPAVADGAFYSTAFETTLKPTSYPGMSRAAHFQEANGALLRAMEGSPEVAARMQGLGINLERTATGLAPRQSPAGWTWHHAPEPGVVQLVPRAQHAPGSIFQPTLHPGGLGGMAIWGK